MTIPTMVVTLVFLVVIGTLLILQQVKSLRRTNASQESENALQGELQRLEERVRTLERIATDHKQSLKDEIDTLK